MTSNSQLPRPSNLPQSLATLIVILVLCGGAVVFSVIVFSFIRG